MSAGRDSHRPSVHDLPIPRDSEVDSSWPPLMVDIASAIGAYATLVLIDRIGGIDVRVPKQPKRDNRIVEAIGMDDARKFCGMFAGEMLALPAGNTPLANARRRPILDRVRAGELNQTEAALLLRSRRDYVRELLKRTTTAPAAANSRTHPGQIDLFASDDAAAHEPDRQPFV